MELDITRIYQTVPENDLLAMAPSTAKAQKLLYNGTGEGSDFLGWLDLPSSVPGGFHRAIKESAGEITQTSELVVVVGIGGSYLGSRAVYDALAPAFGHPGRTGDHPRMVFAGHQIDEDYLYELIELLNACSYSLVVISKSGTTTEPALAFRFLREHLEKKVGKEEARKRIIAITDARKGALRRLADEEGYRSFNIPDDVGGRYSVFTPVGLVPLAACGVDTEALLRGAAEMMRRCDPGMHLEENPAALYATVRNALYAKGKKIEILVNYHSKLHYLSEWWKQLFGESEGKEGKGLFPASVNNSTDLHSLGQYIQEGERLMFESVLSVENPEHKLIIPSDGDNLDQLNYMAGKRVDHVNKMAELGTILAHVEGGVPNIRISIPQLDACHLGQLLYFFENACGISGYLLGINPFNQPGVEAYKKNMFALLDKPGFEEEGRRLREKL